MPKNKITTREKLRQERERAQSLADRSRQLMKKAAQLQEKMQREDVTAAAAGMAQDASKQDATKKK